jgi:choline kinase
MKAIILAAGIGKRLGQNLPKSLLEFNGKSLLARHLDNLESLGVNEIAIAVGYQAQAIESEIQTIATKTGIKTKINTIYNPDYSEGSVISLWYMREYLNCGEDILLMDADVMYHPQILQRLAKTKFANCFLLDRNFEMGEEPVKLCVSQGVLVEFRKQLAANLSYDFAGESVGFFKFNPELSNNLAKCTEAYVTEGKRHEPYEEVIRDLLLDIPTLFGYEDITGLPWVEIDFTEDIQRARTDILPKIEE